MLNFKDKKIGLLGFGTENQALLKWLIEHGANDITICDKDNDIIMKFPISNPPAGGQFPNNFQFSNFKYQTGKKYLKKLEDFDVVFRTPGISPLLPELVQAKKKGVEISSEIKLFMDLCPAKTIGVTGTKGKGTTSTLIYEILKASFAFNSHSEVAFTLGTRSHPTRPDINRGSTATRSGDIPHSNRQVYFGGNIGNPPIEFLDKLTKNDWVVLELSSFQLQDLTKSPNISVVLDIKVDHLDYHNNRAEYVRAKENIVRFQKKNDFAVVNLDYLTSFKFASASPSVNDYYFSRRKSVDLGAYVEWSQKGKGAHFGKIILRTPKKDYEIAKTYDITLRGEHNLENISAAVTASFLAGAKIETIKKVVPKFPGLTHRLEFAGEVNGVKFYNDSFSTTPDTAIAAIKSFFEPIILIAGGSEKGANYSNLGREIAKSSVKTLIAIGVTGPKIAKQAARQSQKDTRSVRGASSFRNALATHFLRHGSQPGSKITMKEIIKTAVKESKPGDVVLLSPASASFGLFKNYKDRGDQFKFAVAELVR